MKLAIMGLRIFEFVLYSLFLLTLYIVFFVENFMLDNVSVFALALLVMVIANRVSIKRIWITIEEDKK